MLNELHPALGLHAERAREGGEIARPSPGGCVSRPLLVSYHRIWALRADAVLTGFPFPSWQLPYSQKHRETGEQGVREGVTRAPSIPRSLK